MNSLEFLLITLLIISLVVVSFAYFGLRLESSFTDLNTEYQSLKSLVETEKQLNTQSQKVLNELLTTQMIMNQEQWNISLIESRLNKALSYCQNYTYLSQISSDISNILNQVHNKDNQKDIKEDLTEVILELERMNETNTITGDVFVNGITVGVYDTSVRLDYPSYFDLELANGVKVLEIGNTSINVPTNFNVLGNIGASSISTELLGASSISAKSLKVIGQITGLLNIPLIYGGITNSAFSISQNLSGGVFDSSVTPSSGITINQQGLVQLTLNVPSSTSSNNYLQIWNYLNAGQTISISNLSGYDGGNFLLTYLGGYGLSGVSLWNT